MIYATSLGLVCGVFVDFGNHVITDIKGTEAKTYFVKNITRDKEGLVTIDNIQNTELLDIGDGEFVKFKNVEGMTEVNDKEFEIYLEDVEHFKIGDTSNFGESGEIFAKKKQVLKPASFSDYAVSRRLFHSCVTQVLDIDGFQTLLPTNNARLREFLAVTEFFHHTSFLEFSLQFL